LVKELPAVRFPSRREYLRLSLTAPLWLSHAATRSAVAGPPDAHEQLLELAIRQEEKRRNRFAAVKARAGLDELQASLRQTFLRLIDDFPARNSLPPVQKIGAIQADGYRIDKLVYQSFPGYHVSALLYRPEKISAPLPGVLSPCGHSENGKAHSSYQILHVNLVKRGFVVLTYDPVGQGERSQFWDAERRRSRFDLSCGEHAVLGNPLYLLGTNLARYRIWDGIRGLDFLASLPEVDPSRIGCVGNSGGGTLTAYIAALDNRVAVAAICCYITTLRRRMANRIQEDPSSDPEQDIFGFVSEGIDHAGLLALRVPKPTLLGAARRDFFPIDGTRESFAEAKRLYDLAGAGDAIELVEADQRHGLTPPLRKAVYRWFERWLANRHPAPQADEIAVEPRSSFELQVCTDGQVNRTFHSRPLLPLALEEFDRSRKPPLAFVPETFRRDVLRLDPELAEAGIAEIAPARAPAATAILCVNGNEASDWRDEKAILEGLGRQGYAVAVVDPRGVGLKRIKLRVGGRVYADPISGVEENVAYNAFLVGKSLLGMRVSDVQAAVHAYRASAKPRRLVVCGRRDAALVACFAALVEPAIDQVAAEEMLLSFRSLFGPEGRAVNAASILPAFLRHFRDVAAMLAAISPRKVLLSAGVAGDGEAFAPNVRNVTGRFSDNGQMLTEWLGA
jgi:dienelactone hydrolase